MQQFRQTRSSLIQEALQPIERHSTELRKLSLKTGLRQSDLVESAIIHLVRHFASKGENIALPLDMDEIISTMQKQRGEY